MRHYLSTAIAATFTSLMCTAYAQAPTDDHESAYSSSDKASSVSVVLAQVQELLDEQLEVELTHPIPIKQAPEGCMVTLTERYCRADKEPVMSFLVLHQRTVGRSSIEKITIDNGCVVTQVKLGVEEDKTGKAQCVGGEPLVRMRLLLSTHPAPNP